MGCEMLLTRHSRFVRPAEIKRPLRSSATSGLGKINAQELRPCWGARQPACPPNEQLLSAGSGQSSQPLQSIQQPIAVP